MLQTWLEIKVLNLYEILSTSLCRVFSSRSIRGRGGGGGGEVSSHNMLGGVRVVDNVLL